MRKVFLVMPMVSLLSLAANYSATRTMADGMEVIRLSDAAHRTEVSIVPSIGNIAYEMKVNGKNAFWFPFSSLREFREKPVLCGNPFLAPWANRIEGMSYFAGGKRFLLNPELGNIRRDSHDNPIHGLLLFSPLWQVTALEGGEGAARVTSRLEFWKHPELMAQFPFAHMIEMTYRLEDGVLEVQTRLENLSAEPMPVGIGFHPYFQLHDTPRDEWKVRLAAREHLLLSRQLIPTGKTEPVRFADPQPLRGTQLDDVFSALQRDANGQAVFSVSGAREKIEVRYGQGYPVAVVYAPQGRSFICFEPMSTITNGFNLSEAGLYRGLQTVPPGGAWTGSYWVAPSGF